MINFLEAPRTDEQEYDFNNGYNSEHKSQYASFNNDFTVKGVSTNTEGELIVEDAKNPDAQAERYYEALERQEAVKTAIGIIALEVA